MFNIGDEVEIQLAGWKGRIIQKTDKDTHVVYAVALEEPNIFTADNWCTPDGVLHNNVGIFTEDEIIGA